MRKNILFFCLVAILMSNYSLKLPLSHKGLDNRPAEYERGIFLIDNENHRQ